MEVSLPPQEITKTLSLPLSLSLSLSLVELSPSLQSLISIIMTRTNGTSENKTIRPPR